MNSAKSVALQLSAKEHPAFRSGTKTFLSGQRILAVLDLRKMFPVDESVYKKIEINVSSDMPRSEM